MARAGGSPPDTMAPRWRGQRGRLEVWYATLSDPTAGVGCWVHHETVAPVSGPEFAHGWTAVFRAGHSPVLERFGPAPVGAAEGLPASVTGAALDPPRLAGRGNRLSWDLTWDTGDPANPPAPALFTFPAWAWAREVLPAAQVVPIPSARFRGRLTVDGEGHALSPATTGGVAHIYGRGNARRWGWLHAELGGGDVLEIVSAVSRHGPLQHLPPATLLQLRLGGRDWPRHPLVVAPRFRSGLRLPTWTVRGTLGRWRLRVAATVPGDAAVHVGYTDPDGASATCTHSTRADADIVLERRSASWQVAAQWHLRGTAHTEVGTRP